MYVQEQNNFRHPLLTTAFHNQLSSDQEKRCICECLRWQRGEESTAKQEAWVGSLGGEDPLEKGMATHSSILAWEIPWTEEPGRLQSRGSQKSWTRLGSLKNNKGKDWDNPKLNPVPLELKTLATLYQAVPRRYIISIIVNTLWNRAESSIYRIQGRLAPGDNVK